MGRSLKTLIIAPHPDDEVLGAGVWMKRQPEQSVHILEITDGSPRDLRFAMNAGFSSRKDHAAARWRELRNALSLLKVNPRNCTRLNFTDLDSYLHLPELIRELTAVVSKVQPDRVLSPAYEGGHPDHDAASLAAAIVHKNARSFTLWEYPLYHSGPQGRMVTGGFLRRGARFREYKILLSPDERLFKAQLLACFTSQTAIVKKFRITKELFRRAPEYDYTRAPHPGLLLYERWRLGVSGAEWRQRAAKVWRVPE